MDRSGMRRDPICGMPGTIERHGQWFCGESCAQEFVRRQSEASCRAPGRRWRDPWVWAPLTGLTLSLAGGIWPGAAGVSRIYLGYVGKVGLPLLVGLLIGGVVDHFVPREYIVTLLSGPRRRVIVRSTLLGFLASSCSHGCLALTLELYRKGASTPAVVSFLLASPWASMSLTLILLNLFGLKGAVVIGLALGIAFVTGLVFQHLARRGLVETNPQTLPPDEGFSIRHDVARRVRQYRWTRSQLAADLRGVAAGMMPLGRMVLGWVQLGLVMSALIGGLVPHGVFVRLLGPSVSGLLMTLAIATIMEVCSEGTAPVAFELYRQTGALGNAFAFLMGGVVTDYTELGALWVNIGRKTVAWMLLVTIPLVLMAGFVLNRWN